MQRAKAWMHMVLPWPMVAWCERLYFAQFGEMVKHLCRPDQDSIDVGANVGTYLHAMMQHSERVYAFEPVSWLAQLLPKKFGRKIVVENVALSHEPSRALLHIPVIDGAPVTGLSTLSNDLAAGTAPSVIFPSRRGLSTRSIAAMSASSRSMSKAMSTVCCEARGGRSSGVGRGC